MPASLEKLREESLYQSEYDSASIYQVAFSEIMNRFLDTMTDFDVFGGFSRSCSDEYFLITVVFSEKEDKTVFAKAFLPFR